MYSNGKKALLMTNDSNLSKKMQEYLFQRYNLRLESTTDALDVLERIVRYDESYELAILDEKVNGLATASQVLKTIKEQNIVPNVLYLSSLQEITNSEFSKELEILPQYFDEMFRVEQTNLRLNQLIAMFNMILGSSTIRDICQTTCRTLVETLDVDCALCVLPRFEESPILRGIVAAHYPDPITDPYEIRLKGSRYFNELVDYFKPVHIPDLYEEKELCQELMDKFSSIFRSALIVPMVINGKFLGYFGVFTQGNPRLFKLTEIDQCLRLADFAAATSVNLFVSGFRKLKLVQADEDDL